MGMGVDRITRQEYRQGDHRSGGAEMAQTTSPRLTLEDVLAAQDGDDRALQRMIDAGQWSLEGSMGRAMMAAIEDGRCILGPEPAFDYWGNRIPSRFEVVPGTKGSVDYAAAMQEVR
jgi:hypothetical protein